jgi:hypothetical protein
MQEIWQIPYPELMQINGFRLITNQRGSRGGGVGFYIRDGIDFKLLQNNSIMMPKSF